MNRRLIALLLVLAPHVPAEVRAQEFTQQTLLVMPFRAIGANRAGRQVAASARGRIGRLVPRRELFVVGLDTVESLLE
jgi:hypothetical protein